RTRPITDTPPILIVDGVWGQVLFPTGATFLDQSGHQRREMRGVDQVILTVMGVWEDGRHQIIHYQLATAEDTAAWSDLLAALIARVPGANAVLMGDSDCCTGLPAAPATKVPHAKPQRCGGHNSPRVERPFCYPDPPAPHLARAVLIWRLAPAAVPPTERRGARDLRGAHPYVSLRSAGSFSCGLGVS